MCSTKEARVYEINLILNINIFLTFRIYTRTSYFLDWIYNNWVIEKPLANVSLSLVDSPASISTYGSTVINNSKIFFITDTTNTIVKPTLTRRCRNYQFKT